MTARTVVLWRHGRTAYNATARLQGQVDIPLDEVGRWQADEAAAWLEARFHPQRIVSSDLGRAVATAEALAGRCGVDVELDDRLRERGVRLKVSIPADIGHFIADDKRVRQVLFNLLSNAAGFSPPGEAITLTAARDQDAVTFTITDLGPGIPPELKDRIFARFESHTLGSQHRGAGLGLPIVRSLMELHGGAVTIDSQPGQGTLVTCVFPTHAAAGTQAAE